MMHSLLKPGTGNLTEQAYTQQAGIRPGKRYLIQARQVAKWWMLVLLLGIVSISRAQTSVTFKGVLDGSKNQLVQNAQVSVQDTVYFDPALQSRLSKPYPVRNIITFKINEYSNLYLPVKFSATANVRITYTYPDLSTETVDKSLVIDYDTSGKYTVRNSFVFNNAHQVTVKLLDISSDAGNGILPALIIENEMQAQPLYVLSCTADAVTAFSNNPALTPNTDSTDQIIVSWNPVTGADEYDLEWAYIDSSALSTYGNPIDRRLIFVNNATRVTIKANSYAIPLLYDNGGVLYYRVRAVQQKGNDQRMETVWSTDFTNGLGRFDFCGHQRNLNWQSTVSYAEEGKRKAVVQYYDGSLRARQTVTKDNTTNTTLVSESYYDYQGRPVITVLPAPTLNSIIKYSHNFNRKDLPGQDYEYDKNEYDSIGDPLEFLTASAKPMSDESGANQYYSANTPDPNNGFNKFIPRANKYAFTEVSYTPDNTGRISRQSGVGPTYKLGSNHETQYFYNTAAQKELDALFGTEVGNESHYFKNMVRDANGQYAVSYQDMHGRTIATALAGEPDSASLAPLPSDVPFTVTDVLSGPGKNQVKGLLMESRKSQAVPVKGEYTFSYTLTPPVLPKDKCDTLKYFKGLYNLEITITDDMNNQRLPNHLPIVQNIPIPAITADSANPAPITLSFTVVLEKGSYEITKRLTISRKGLEYYRDQVLMAYSSCNKTLDDFIQEQRTLLINDQCTPTCKSCIDSLGTWDVFRAKYMSRAGITSDTASYRGEAWAAYLGAQEACSALCNNQSEGDDIKRAMLLDVTGPSGQYADPADAGNSLSIFYKPNTSAVPVYQRDDIVYLDEKGKPDSVYDMLSHSYVRPQQLAPDAFAAAFKESWAPLLLPYHPEYCKLLEYQKYEASNSWDRRFEAVDTYAAAKDSGFLNPIGSTKDAFVNFPALASKQDPLSTGDLRSQLEDNMLAYKSDKGSGRKYSIWSTATITVKCPENNDACVVGYMPVTEAFNESVMCAGDLDMAWRSFRQLYLQLKRDLINARIMNAVCPGGQRGPTNTDIINAGKQPNFNSASDALSQNGLGFLKDQNFTAAEAKGRGQDSLNKAYENNCTAYAKLWMQQLATCRFYTQADLDVIIPRLVTVCKEGSDQNHVNGASTVRPESTNSYRSFQQVLNEYNSQHSIATSAECNGEIITTPKPYDRQPVYGSKATYTKPADCECEKLNVLRAEFLSLRKTTDSNFAAYLVRTRGIKMLESNLVKLLAACNSSAAGCTYLAAPLEIPAIMQCYTASACATCNVVDSLYTQFTNAYPNIHPAKTETDTIQQQENTLFANFMNNRLGFSKSAWEYLVFRDSCKNIVEQDTSVCVPSAQQLIKIYTSGGNDVMSDIVRTSDNGYLLAGSTIPGQNTSLSRTAETNFVSNKKDGYLIKTDSKGVLQWAKTYGGTADEEFARIKPTVDGGYIAIGRTTEKHFAGDVYIVKIDANANVVWSRAIGLGTTNGERGYDIIQMDNGTYAFSGAYNYGPSVADWLVGTIAPDGTLNWLKRIGSSGADPTAYLVATGDTLVLSGSADYYSYYDGVISMINRNTGAYIKGTVYDLEHTSTLERSSWFGNIYKTDAGYKVSVLDTKDYGSDDGTSIILDIDNQGGVLSAKALPRPPQNVGWLPMALTADGGAIVSQRWVNTPRNIYLHKIAANNTVTWSNQITLAGDEVIGGLLQNPDGSFAGAGVHDGSAMLVLPTSTGKTGCQDSAMASGYTDVPYIIGTFAPAWNQLLFPTDINMNVVAQSYSPTESVAGCTGFDSCYRVSNGPLLCGNAEEIFPATLLDSLNNCSDNEFFAVNTGTILYKAYQDSVKNNFEQDYINTCLKATELENFTVTYSTSEYHYTLYYYDQAGNLVKTVPPAGVVVNRSDTWLNQVKAARAAGQVLRPAHTLVTRYRYNTLNQVIAQLTPDAGTSHFWYDRLGRLAISQNAKQILTHDYSYTLYDSLGRITEVGQINSNTAMTDNISRSDNNLQGWLTSAAGTKTQITRTVYDQPHSPLEGIAWNAANLRNRVSWTAVYNTAADLAAGTQRSSATFYSYDILGNVKELLQDYNSGLPNNAANRFKKILYNYDLVSGKVNMVSYQPGQKDAFYHRYSYDAENRITNVETSFDSIYWENDAFYQYYKHGPLARMVLGQQQVQGMDYAYTLQGWLKGVNSTTLTPDYDMGHDGATGSITARDALGYSLHYFGERDYKAANGTAHPFVDGESAGAAFKPLFNGNIGAISLNLPKVGEPLLYTYGYDVLNRLVTMNTARNLNTTTNNWQPIGVPDFGEQISYDANGNILTYNRKGNSTWAGKPQNMDQLTYHYQANTNKLTSITDQVTANAYDNDIDDQATGNYGYDSIGNLTQDLSAGIPRDSLKWTVYGKIKSITKNNPDNSKTFISYTYDPTGNRLSKTVINGTDTVETRYIRDATGNVMSVYVGKDPAVNSGALTQREVHLYGSSRLGIFDRTVNVQDTSRGDLTNVIFARGNKFFELSNHLGNVLATAMDSKMAFSTNGSVIDHYEAHLASAQDYYPFGMLEPGRNWNIGNYRYGFNGKENDNEVKGEGNQQDYGMRVYDPRIGRFLSVDPLYNQYPYLTPYQFAENSPIRFVDLDGQESWDAFVANLKKTGRIMLEHTTAIGVGFANAHLSNQVLGVGRKTPSEYQRISNASESNKLAYATGQIIGDVFSIKQGASESEIGVAGAPESGGLSLGVAGHGLSVIGSSLIGAVKTITDVTQGSGNQENVGSNSNQNSRGQANENSPQQEVPEFEPVNLNGKPGGSQMNKEIKKVANGEGTPRSDDHGLPATFQNRNNTAVERKWAGAHEYEVLVPNQPNTYRILKKEIGQDANGAPIFKYGYTTDHYKTVYEFVPKK